LTPQQLVFLVIVVAAFALLITERLRNDLVAILIVLALAGTGVLKPNDALAGFSSEPAIVVASIFVLSGAIQRTGLAELIGRWIGRVAGKSYRHVILVIMPAVALLSIFTHHVTTTALMLPVTLDLSRKRNIPPSKLLMPMSFAASLGTTISIIGAPAFLIASEVLRQAGRPGLAIFSIAPIGLALSLAGTLFVLLVGWRILPAREEGVDPKGRFRLDQYFTEVKVLPDSPWIGKTLTDVKGGEQYQFTAAAWVRDSQRLRAFENERLRAGDVLLVHTTPEDIVAFRRERGIELHPVDQYGSSPASPPGEDAEVADKLVQAVVAPTADIIGRTLRDLDFRRRYGPIVVGLWRRAGFLRQELAEIRLRAGDVLVLEGTDAELARVAQDPAFLLLMPFEGESRLRRKARLAGAIMLATILAASLNVASLEITMLAGAAAAILGGCLTPRQAYQSIDARIYVFIAGAIPLGAALRQTGLSAVLASWLQRAVGGWDEIWILLAIYAVVGVATQFMSDAATTALFAPVALALAQVLGRPPEPYVVTVAMAAVAAFLTPIGHHGNLLVYGPGNYRFSDFTKVGTPLTILSGAIVVFIAQALWRAP
jgi:di/tricarboxylate transporter